MYFGSVKFFKHLIVTVLVLAILVPSTCAVVFAVQKNKLNQSLITAEEALESQKKQQIAHEDMAYQKLYPELYSGLKAMVPKKEAEKTVYLTFDDGPSKVTPLVLDALKAHNVKATFFVVYHNDDFSKQIYKRIVNEGHTIAVHTASHDYKKIYESMDSYLADFDKMYQQIFEITGVKPQLFRFPGGSINGYNQTNYQELIGEMGRRGFIYHDWNISSLDATGGKISSSDIYKAVVRGVKTHTKSVVLMHDSGTKESTAKALPQILKDLQAAGYTFDRLDASVKPFIFGYPE